MNLEDLIDPEFGLQQDDFVGTKFGNDNQLEVVGWSGKYKRSKIYILRCTKCAEDSALFGEGYFSAMRYNLNGKRIPCGCSKYPKWSELQYSVLCERKAHELGYKFLGWSEFISCQKTKLQLQCREHGVWESTTIDNLIRGGTGCPKCAPHPQKTDEEWMECFMSTGKYHPDTKFWKSERKDRNGYSPYWWYICPDCGDTAETTNTSLKKGRKACLCTTRKQTESYINLVHEGSDIVAVKFGISHIVTERIKQQQRGSIYELQNYGVWKFPNKQDCINSERECKIELVTGVLTKHEFGDGYTETTYPYNIDKIVKIYEGYGGMRIQ